MKKKPGFCWDMGTDMAKSANSATINYLKVMVNNAIHNVAEMPILSVSNYRSNFRTI